MTDMVVPGGIARDTGGRLYVANASTNTVTIYGADATGNVPPLAVIGGSLTRLASPAAVVLDSMARIYVVNDEYLATSITVYPPLGANTGILNEAPISIIAGSKTLLDFPAGIAIDDRGNIYVANGSGGPVVHGQPLDSGRVTVYSAGSSGNVAPMAVISGAHTGLAIPDGIALDGDGNIYVTNAQTANTGDNPPYNGSITIYSTGSKGDAQPRAIIDGSNTGLTYPRDIALDSNRNIYVTGDLSGFSNAIDVYAAGSAGNVSPIATLAGADTGLAGSIAITLDSDGELYVLNSGGGPSGRAA